MDSTKNNMKIVTRNKVQVIVTSESNPRKRYKITKLDGKWGCECLAFRFHWPSKKDGCKHMQFAKVG